MTPFSMKSPLSILLVGLFLSATGQVKNSVVIAATDDSISSTPKQDKILFELIGGPGLTMFYGDKINDKIPYLRYTIVLGTAWQISKLFDLNAKMMWEAKGVKTEYWGVADDGLQPARFVQGQELDYLTLSLGASYYLDCNRRLSIGSGLGVSKLITQWTYTYQYAENGETLSTYRADARDSFKGFDVGLTFSIAYHRVLFRHTMISTQLFGNLGVIHVYQASQPYNGSIKNANLALLIGIGIGRS